MSRRGWLVQAGVLIGGVTLVMLWNRDPVATSEVPDAGASSRRRLTLADLAGLSAPNASSRGGALSGTVKGDGNGVAHVAVEGDGRRYRIEAKEDGTFSFEHLPPGAYVLTGSRGDLASDPLGPIPVADDEEIRDLVLTLAPGGGVSGVVLDGRTRQPIVHALLVAGSAEAETNDSGEFTLRGLPAGEIAVAVRAIGYGEARPRVVIPRGKQQDGTEILLMAQAHVKGRVQQADQKPVPGVALMAQRYTFGVPESPSTVGSTADDGTFDGYVQPGRVTLFAAVSGGGEARSEELELGAGAERFNLVLTVDVGGQIVGSALDRQGQPALGAQVTAFETTTQHEQGAALVSGEGRFQIDGLPAGTYAVVARLGRDTAQSVGLRIDSGDVVSTTVQFGTGTLSGRVLDPANQPVLAAMVQVSAEGAGGQGGPPVETRADGRFQVEGLSGTRFAVEVTHVSGHAELHGVAGGSTDLVIHLAGQSELRGYVVDDQGKAVTDFQVLADPVDVGLKSGEGGKREERRFASATGDFHFTVAPGKYSVRVSASGFTTASGGFADAPLGGSSSDIRVTLRRTRTITAVVINGQNGQPISGAKVATNPNLLYAFGRADPVHFGGYAITDGSGQASLSDAEPGNTRLFAAADGYQWAAPVGVPAEQDPGVPVRITLNPGDSGNHDFSGVGMQIGPDFRIGNVFDSGPADLSGIHNGDTLVSVDGTPVQGLDLNSVIGTIRGETGTPVVLGLSRDGQTFFVVPTRAAIKF